MANADDIVRQIDELSAKLTEPVRAKNEAIADGDGPRKAAADASIDALSASIATLSQALSAESIREQVKAALHAERAPSKAGLVGGSPLGAPESRRIAPMVDAYPALKASFSGYEAGEFLSALMDVHGIGLGGIDVERIASGKARLSSLSSYAGVPAGSAAYSVVDGTGKAVLGATGATGGYVLPNNLVDTVVKPKTQEAVYQTLLTVVNGVAVRGVDQPYRTGAPARMAFQDWGSSKENVNEAYGSYTSTLATMARVIDIGKQYARFSAGSAEADVMDELTRAAILGENFYIIAGAGTGSIGTGDPSVGVYTALTTAPSGGGYTTAFSSASTSTVAGSAATAFATMLGALAGRSRSATAIVTDAATFWTILREGSDTAGFWVSPTGGPTGFTRTESGGISFWGVPLYFDANLNANTGASKLAIAGDWKTAKLYRGMEFRIDTSDQAGSRWDENLIGFRGEQEIGFNASSQVSVGAFQLGTSIIP